MSHVFVATTSVGKIMQTVISSLSFRLSSHFCVTMSESRLFLLLLQLSAIAAAAGAATCKDGVRVDDDGDVTAPPPVDCDKLVWTDNNTLAQSKYVQSRVPFLPLVWQYTRELSTSTRHLLF